MNRVPAKHALIGLGAACVFALCLAAVVLIVRTQRQSQTMQQFIAAGPANLAREEAAARREGIPLTAAALQKPLPPPAQNAAPLYVKLTKLLHDKPLGLPKYAEGMDAFHSYTPQQIAAVRRTLAARQDVMTLIHQAADKPQCVFVRDWNQGTKLALPEYLPMREAARLIETESYLLACDGHYQEAIVNQRRGFQVADHAASDPVLLAYLVGVACESITLSGIQSISALAGPNAAVDTGVQQIMDTKCSRPSLREAMAGETGFDCVMFPKMHSAEGQGIEAALEAAGFSDDETRKVQVSPAQQKHLHSLIDAWQADFLSRMRPLVVASNQSPSVRRAGYEAVSNQIKRDADDPDGVVHLLADILVPVFGSVDQNDTRIQAREMVTLAAATLLGKKATAGSYPDALPAGFVDPFTGKPLGYRREGVGFVIYSAGPTGRFGGGRPGEKAGGQESVFRYPVVRE